MQLPREELEGDAMKVGDLVRYRSFPDMYGIVVEVRPNAWVGNQVAVNWVESGRWRSHRLYYAQDELEVINEKQV